MVGLKHTVRYLLGTEVRIDKNQVEQITKMVVSALMIHGAKSESTCEATESAGEDFFTKLVVICLFMGTVFGAMIGCIGGYMICLQKKPLPEQRSRDRVPALGEPLVGQQPTVLLEGEAVEKPPETIFVTRSGECFHNKTDCRVFRGVRGSKAFRPCRHCWPRWPAADVRTA